MLSELALGSVVIGLLALLETVKGGMVNAPVPDL